MKEIKLNVMKHNIECSMISSFLEYYKQKACLFVSQSKGENTFIILLDKHYTNYKLIKD